MRQGTGRPSGCAQLGGGAVHVAVPLGRHALCSEQLLNGPGLTPKPSSPPIAVRVVNNVVKRNDVRSRLYAAVQGENYPEAFMYKQKVRLAVVCPCAWRLAC